VVTTVLAPVPTTTCADSLQGDTMEVFGAGPDAEGPSIALLLHAGFLRLSRALEEHGR
jgi:hypothetical protein